MILNFKKYGSGPPLIILHGLFGMLDNWRSIAAELQNSFTVYLPDQRNHGKSPHMAEHNYHVLANDLLEFMEQLQIQKACIAGHSMGGKAAMQFAAEHPEKVNKLIVIDMGVKRYPAGHDNIFNTLMQFDPAAIKSRSEAETQLQNSIPDKAVRLFVLKNLSREKDGTYHWKFNLKGLRDNYESGILAPVEGKNIQLPVLFIRGEHSDYILENDMDEIRAVFPNAQFLTIPGAGHWVHTDQPAALIAAINSFLLQGSN